MGKHAEGYHLDDDEIERDRRSWQDILSRKQIMNFARLQQARIPDLAPVYEGARGRTLSSRHLGYTWRALREAGVKTVIDLREGDKSERLPALCEEYGMEYFHYPIDSAGETIALMIEKFPELCRLIDKGDFYIACALGLHRTDTALCLYWMFHGADRGMAQPQLHGYLREKGLQPDKMMRRINAFYNLCAGQGNEPVPEDVFKRRKQMITEVWRGNVQ